MPMFWSRSDRGGRALRQAVGDCLADLGDSPDAVARRLQLYAVQGRPGRADDCPMARYLWAVIGSERTVGRIGVLERRLRVTRRGLRMPFSVALPPAVRGFVRSFDEGHYPQLVELDVTATVADPDGTDQASRGQLSTDQP